jgi:hypothetical protein
MSVAPVGSKPPFTAVKWLICIITSIGFAFDIYALLMAQYVIPPALKELGGLTPGTPKFAWWAGMMFWVPAIAGGIFGLLGGYLTGGSSPGAFCCMRSRLLRRVTRPR